MWGPAARCVLKPDSGAGRARVSAGERGRPRRGSAATPPGSARRRPPPPAPRPLAPRGAGEASPCPAPLRPRPARGSASPPRPPPCLLPRGRRGRGGGSAPQGGQVEVTSPLPPPSFLPGQGREGRGEGKAGGRKGEGRKGGKESGGGPQGISQPRARLCRRGSLSAGHIKGRAAEGGGRERPKNAVEGGPVSKKLVAAPGGGGSAGRGRPHGAQHKGRSPPALPRERAEVPPPAPGDSGGPAPGEASPSLFPLSPGPGRPLPPIPQLLPGHLPNGCGPSHVWGARGSPLRSPGSNGQGGGIYVQVHKPVCKVSPQPAAGLMGPFLKPSPLT